MMNIKAGGTCTSTASTSNTSNTSISNSPSTTTSGVKIDVDEEVPYSKPGTEVASSRVANPSIGEVSLGASLSLGSGSHLDRVGCTLTLAEECDRESASNTALAGHSLTGSVASSYIGHQRLEVGADVHPRKKFSFSSERLSETVSLSEKSGSVSLAEDGASTRALAGSLLAYRMEKMENTSVNSYRLVAGKCNEVFSRGDKK